MDCVGVVSFRLLGASAWQILRSEGEMAEKACAALGLSPHAVWSGSDTELLQCLARLAEDAGCVVTYGGGHDVALQALFHRVIAPRYDGAPDRGRAQAAAVDSASAGSREASSSSR